MSDPTPPAVRMAATVAKQAAIDDRPVGSNTVLVLALWALGELEDSDE